MLILDHGNICVDTIFMIIIMHCFPDIEENLFFDNGGPHLHTRNVHIWYYNILSDSMIILDHGNICVDNNFMILSCIVFPDIDEIRFFDNVGPHLHTHTYAYS